MLYDETSWQDKSAFKPIIKNSENKMEIDILVRKKDYDENAIVCITNCQSEIRWNKPDIIEFRDEYVRLVFSILPKFNHCGYYDYNVVKFKNGQFGTIKEIIDGDEPKSAKGRFIVVDTSIKDLSIHEVFPDQLADGGNFKTIENKLEDYNQRYINCLYIMGALERDNQIIVEGGEVVDIANAKASPMAVTCRATISRLLGGEKAFNSMANKAKMFSMKIFVDSLSRVSSSHPHRKYRNILLHTLDESGKVNICYGSDGHSVNYEDSAILNYRKIESWDLLVDDIISLAGRNKIDGIHLDNCQAWPQIGRAHV